MENGSANNVAVKRDLLPTAEHPSVQKFFKGREELISREKEHRSDHEFRQSLSPAGKRASAIVSRIRSEERHAIWKTEGNKELNETELFPGMMFNVAKSHMESTKLWKIVQKLPKGALLHAHLGATVDLEWVFNEALRTKGICVYSSIPLASDEVRGKECVRFAYSSVEKNDVKSIWESGYMPNTLIPAAIAAENFPDGGRKGFVAWMKDHCSITQTESLQHHLGVDDVWKKLQQSFEILTPIIYYEPVLRAFIRKLFETLLIDGVRWMEMRTVLITKFALEGQDVPISQSMELCRVIYEEIESFTANEEGFWGSRLIWTSMRGQKSANIIEDMSQCIEAKKRFPKLISGYDLVGQEDLGRSLHDLTPVLVWFQERCKEEGVEIPFFFHAGECLGDGDETDQNLYDAILFGTRRIGHGFSLYKHPLLIDVVKDKKILVESCPISNEVLRYTASIMSHPLPALLSRGVAAALSNDDPALLGQGTSGMTHDFWQALQGWENLGLEGLGSLAQNSVRWAAYEDQDEDEWLKDVAAGSSGNNLRSKRMKQWREEWEQFCQWVAEEFGENSL